MVPGPPASPRTYTHFPYTTLFRSDDVHAIGLKQKSGRVQYLYVDDIEGVIDLVQMNTLEFHPWGARVDDPEQPDRMVFDLDPGEGVRWPGVVAAARETRDRLRRAGQIGRAHV